MRVEPRECVGGCQEHYREDGVTERAYKPSAHGTKTVESSHADPPQAPEHTRRLATWPPIPPSAPAASRYATPSLPITTARPSEGSSATPAEPRSVSPAFNAAQLEGAK